MNDDSKVMSRYEGFEIMSVSDGILHVNSTFGEFQINSNIFGSILLGKKISNGDPVLQQISENDKTMSLNKD